MSCSGDGLKSFIAGIAILVQADGLTDSCTPDDASVLDGVPTISISGTTYSA
jgi:hypothetical protein